VTVRWNQEKELRKRVATLEAQIGRLSGLTKTAS
jgi:hypothetical protein